MGIKTKVDISGEMVDGEEVSFQTVKEEWNTYNIEDGSSLKVKAIPVKVIRTEKKQPQRNDPIYVVMSQVVVDVSVPEKLKKNG